MADVAALLAGLKRKDEKEKFSGGGGDGAAFLLVYLAFVVIIWGFAFYMASSCSDKAVNYVVAFFFPVIYIIVRLIAPCKR